MTRHRRISSISIEAETRRYVIRHSTFGIDPANSRTRIFTFVVQTRLVSCAVGVCNTFRSASWVRISKIFRYTYASSCSVSFSTFGVCSARWWVAWIASFFYRSYRDWRAAIKRIPCKSYLALAVRWVIGYDALSVESTRTGTRIFAFFVDACQISWTFLVYGTFGAAIGRTPYIVG